MFRTWVLTFIFLLGLFALPVQANHSPDHEHSHDHNHHHGRIHNFLGKYVFKGDLGELYQGGHDIIEHHPGRFFNLKQLALTALRWKNMNEGSKWSTHVKNFGFMFGLSHGTEVMTIPLSVGYCLVEAGSWVITQDPMAWQNCITYFMASLVIANPGTDPLCWLVFIPYFTPGVNKLYQPLVTKTRHGTLKFVSEWLTHRQPRTDYLLDNFSGEQFVDDYGDQVLSLNVPLGQLSPEDMQLIVKQDSQGRAHLASARIPISELGSFKKKDLKKHFRKFGWNTSNALMSLVRQSANNDLDGLKDQLHVESAQIENSSVKVSFVPSALALGDKATLSYVQLRDKVTNTCAEIITQFLVDGKTSTK